MWDRFLRACRREPVDRTPVWFMRQAGRYMPEYRALREKYSLLELCRNPELACSVSLQPVNAHSVDAAILFSDILLPLAPMGASFDFTAGDGPVVHGPIRSAADVRALRVVEPEEDLGHVLETLRLLRHELHGKTPLIGFAGAPFTLASYLVEGGKSATFAKTKAMMFTEPALWRELMGKLAEVTRRFTLAQVRAGADCIQLFDSWVGELSPVDYREFVAPHLRPVFQDLEGTGVPVIHFGTGTGSLLELQRETGGTVIGIDWRTSLRQARDRLGPDVALQGNLDPHCLLAPREFLKARVVSVLREAAGLTGHIFNLGHGVLPQTPPDNVRYVRELVHELSAVRPAAK